MELTKQRYWEQRHHHSHCPSPNHCWQPWREHPNRHPHWGLGEEPEAERGQQHWSCHHQRPSCHHWTRHRLPNHCCYLHPQEHCSQLRPMHRQSQSSRFLRRRLHPNCHQHHQHHQHHQRRWDRSLIRPQTSSSRELHPLACTSPRIQGLSAWSRAECA